MSKLLFKLSALGLSGAFLLTNFCIRNCYLICKLSLVKQKVWIKVLDHSIRISDSHETCLLSFQP